MRGPEAPGPMERDWSCVPQRVTERLHQRYVVVFADALEDEERERRGAGVGDEMRTAGHRDVALPRAEADLLLGFLQEQPHLALQHIEGVADAGVIVPGHRLGR